MLQFRAELTDTETAFVTRWHYLAEQHIVAFLAGTLSFPEQRWRRIRALFAIAPSDAEADRRFASYVTCYEQAWTVFPDVVPCLTQLAGLSLGSISHGNAVQQRQKIEVLGLAAHLTVVLISEEVGLTKPDPRLFTLACQHAGVPPMQCVYGEERLDTDARAAQAAGLTGIWLHRTTPHELISDVLMMRDLAALPSILGVHAPS